MRAIREATKAGAIWLFFCFVFYAAHSVLVLTYEYVRDSVVVGFLTWMFYIAAYLLVSAIAVALIVLYCVENYSPECTQTNESFRLFEINEADSEIVSADVGAYHVGTYHVESSARATHATRTVLNMFQNMTHDYYVSESRIKHLTITRPLATIVRTFKQTGVVQLRDVVSSKLLLGCGNGPIYNKHKETHMHEGYTTISCDLNMNPTIVGQFGSIHQSFSMLPDRFFTEVRFENCFPHANFDILQHVEEIKRIAAPGASIWSDDNRVNLDIAYMAAHLNVFTHALKGSKACGVFYYLDLFVFLLFAQYGVLVYCILTMFKPLFALLF
jgi:hypothetical protein